MEETKTSRLKIFYLTTDTKIGGTERMLLALLSGLDRNKYNPFVCAIKPEGPLIEEAKKMGVRGKCLINQAATAEDEPRRYVERGVIPRIKNVLVRFIGLLLVPFKLFILLKREKPDILHTFLFHANILGRIIGRATGVPVIISSQRSVDKWRKPWHSLIDRWTSGFCNLIISNSEAGRKILIEREKINPKKIITIYNGIDSSEFDMEINIPEKRKEFGFSSSDIIIGIIANLREVKGHRYLFEAVANICSGICSGRDNVVRPDVTSGRLAEDKPRCYKSFEQARPLHIKTLVVGEGILKQELINLSEKLGIKDNVIFAGFRDDIPEILKVIDIFVLPSLWEGFPVSILEAMASAKPVIASRVGGIPEVVVDGETGLLTPPGDVQAIERAIIELIGDPEKSKKMGEAGRNRVKEHFTLNRMIEKTEEVYDGFRRCF